MSEHRTPALPDERFQPYMSVEEAGAIVGLGRSASYRAIARGELPALRFGRKLVVPVARLRALLGVPGPGPIDGDAA